MHAVGSSGVDFWAFSVYYHVLDFSRLGLDFDSVLESIDRLAEVDVRCGSHRTIDELSVQYDYT